MPTKMRCDAGGNILGPCKTEDDIKLEQSHTKEESIAKTTSTTTTTKATKTNKSDINRIAFIQDILQSSTSSSYKKGPNTKRIIREDIILMAVVLSMTIPSTTERNYCTLIITDPSLPLHACATVVIGRNESDSSLRKRMDSLSIRPGDILCFRGLLLWKHHLSLLPPDHSAQQQQQQQQPVSTVLEDYPPTIICEFRFAHEFQLECGLSKNWRLLRVRRCENGTESTCNSFDDDNNNNNHHHLSSPSFYDGDDDKVKQLVQRYRSYGLDGRISSQLPCVTPPTRRRRRLREITSPNLMSDVVIRILSCDVNASTRRHFFPGSKQAQKKPGGTRAIPSSSFIAHALLSDGPKEEDVMPFYECAHLGPSLRHLSLQNNEPGTAKDTSKKPMTPKSTPGRWILLTHVLSRKLSDNDTNISGILGSSSGIVLVPTAETSIVDLGSHDDTKGFDLSAFGNKSNKQNKRRRAFTSPLDYGSLVPSFDISQMQPSQYSPKISPSNSDNKRHLVVVVAKVLDVWIGDNEISLLKASNQFWSSPQNLMSLLIDRDKFPSRIAVDGAISKNQKIIHESAMCQYKSATIILAPRDHHRNEHLPVKANGNIIQILCASCDAYSLSEESNKRLVPLVRDLMRSMITEPIYFDWMLRRTNNDNAINDNVVPSWSVIDVVLPVL